jgi:hypothetical protein
MSKKTYGVLLTDDGWTQLAEPMKLHVQHGQIGRYLYCLSVKPEHPFVVLTFEKPPLNFWIHPHMIKTVVVWDQEAPIGFCPTGNTSNCGEEGSIR